MHNQLEKLGLTPGESKVYLALLKRGPSKVGDVVKESGVSYSKVYDVLERLVGKGLASEVLINGIKQYRALEPYRLSELLAKRENEIAEQKKIFSSLLPDLQKISKDQGRSSAEVFVGFEGLKTAYEILLEEKGKILRFFYPPHDEKAATFFQRLYPKMVEAKIEMRGIGTVAPVNKLPVNIKIRTVSFPVPGTIDVIGDKVLILSWSDTPTAVLIHSVEIAKHFEEYFDGVWSKAK
ncbi:TrmB family transcriptional regulator [Candidatus Woesearchaeota archaeon]|nr:TrmB family transcriptional regulator [Candidatus Woesearchaeota archaeon]